MRKRPSRAGGGLFRRKARSGIRERLVFWLLAFGIVPVTVTALLAYWALTRAEERAAGNRLVAVAERVAGGVDAEVRMLVQNLGGPDPGFTGLARHMFPLPARAELARIQARDSVRYVAVSVADSMGNIIATTGPDIGPVVRDEDWWRIAWNRGAGSTYISRLLRMEEDRLRVPADTESRPELAADPDPVGEQFLSVVIALPVRNEQGRAIGVLKATVDVSGLDGIVRGGRAGATGSATITSGYGDILAAAMPGSGRAPVVTTDRHHRFAVGIPGWFAGRGLSGREAIIGFAPVKATAGRSQAGFGGTGWYVTAEQDRAEVLQPVREFGRYAVIVGLLVATMILLVGLVLSRRIARPLVELRDGARRIGSGKLDLRLSLKTGDEIEDLADEFNAMAGRLDESRRGLEERVRVATAELAREHGSLQAIVAALGEGLMVLDTQLNIVLWNRAAERMTGFSAQEVIGRGCDSVIATEREGRARLCFEGCPARAAIAARSAVTSPDMSAVISCRDGRRLPVTYTATPLLDTAGRATGCVVVLRDITREKEIDRLKSEVISTVSHELRSPLSSIIGFAELLDDPTLTEEKRNQYNRFILTEGRRLERMVDNFLALSRIEAGRLELELEEVDLREIIAEVFAHEAAPNPRHRLRCDITPGFPRIRADRERIKRVLHNLIANAVKYSPDGGPVVVSAAAGEERVEVSVRDQGIGIRAEDQERLFHRFQRLHRSERPDIRGTGLGLAISASIVKEHGGEVRVESVYGTGSTFTVILPRAGPKDGPERG